MTPYSLYAAVSVGLETEDIIKALNRLSKVPVPENISQFIRQCTLSYGKVKLVLKHNRYYVESGHPDTLQMLLKDGVIAQGRVWSTEADNNTGGAGMARKDGLIVAKAPSAKDLMIPGTQKNKDGAAADALKGPLDEDKEKAEKEREAEERRKEDEKLFGAVVTMDKDDEDDFDGENVHAFEIAADHVEVGYHIILFLVSLLTWLIPTIITCSILFPQNIKKRCNEIDYPMLEEYDFRNDILNPNLEIDLKPITVIRPYQEKSLSKMFGNGRARSGIIVLPCGAGKTLVGITAACTIKKSCLVLCTSSWVAEDNKEGFN